MNFDNIVCPISFEKIDNNVSRLTIFMNVVLIIVFLITQQFIFMLLVTIDYCIRAFAKIELSPLRWMTVRIASQLKWHKKMTGLAPKVFASRLGFLCAFLSTIFCIMGLNTTSIVIGGMLLIFTVGDSIFNLCVGCLIYNYLVYPFYKKRKSS